MAELGSLKNTLLFSHGTTYRTLSGYVSGATPLTNIRVVAHRIPSGAPAASCFPNVDGTFSMQVDGDPKTYYVVALSPSGATHNAVINDRVASV